MSNTLPINPAVAVTAIKNCIQAGLVPMLAGSPGVGKSSIMRQVAEELNLEYIDIRLAQSDPLDLVGLPVTTGKKMEFLPPVHFPIEGLDEVPDGRAGWLCNLDEINSAPPSVQVAAYRLVLDKEVGQHKLHSEVHMVAAGNLATDRAIVNRIGTAMQSRLVHLQLDVSTDDWVDWALENSLDTRIVAFIRFRPELLHKFDPNHNDVTFASPRTWEFASKLIKPWSDIGSEPHHLPLIAGTVGQGAALEFKGYIELLQELPDPDMLILDPKGATVPKEPGALYAVSGLVASKMTEDNVTNTMVYLKRLPSEFQLLAIRDVLKTKPELGVQKEIQQWKIKNAKAIFGDD